MQGAFVEFDVLIGMDIITQGDFAVTNRCGRTKFSFRFPSQADIDFVSEDNSRNVLRAKGSTSPSQTKRDAIRRKKRRK